MEIEREKFDREKVISVQKSTISSSGEREIDPRKGDFLAGIDGRTKELPRN